MFLVSSLLASVSTESQMTSDEKTQTSSEEQPLDEVSVKRTISDAVDRFERTEALPGDWELKFDIIYGQSDDLAEVVVLSHPSHASEYQLEPTNTFEPLGETRVSVKRTGSTEEHIKTASSFEDGYRRAVQHINRLEQRTKKPTKADWESPNPDTIGTSGSAQATAAT
jgi:hypothetical protein